jgi:hypothetical protein
VKKEKYLSLLKCIGDMRNAYKTLVGSLKGRDHSEDLGVDGA